MKHKPVVFFDYHGVLAEACQDACDAPPATEFMSADRIEALRSLNGYRLFVVSNQVGVARGDFSEADLRGAIRRFRHDLRRAGVIISDFLYCPHHPCALMPTHRAACSCRKLSPFHVVNTLARLRTPPSRAAFVGDTIETDMGCALAAGVIPILITDTRASLLPPDVYTVDSLRTAVELLDRKFSAHSPTSEHATRLTASGSKE